MASTPCDVVDMLVKRPSDRARILDAVKHLRSDSFQANLKDAIESAADYLNAMLIVDFPLEG